MIPALHTIINLLEAKQLEEARGAILRWIREDPETVKPYSVNLANLLVACSGWEQVGRLIPRETNGLTVMGWVASLFAGRPINAHGAPIPWFTYPAIEFLDRIDVKTFDVFEFGSGNSTLWWAGRARSVRSVDHDKTWFERMKSGLPQNAHIELQSETKEYVGAIQRHTMQFDVIVVDGVHRNECAEAAIRHGSEGGLIIFDNSDRRANAPGIQNLMEAGYRRIDFFGMIPSYLYRACTSVFFKDDRYLRQMMPPSETAQSLGPTCAHTLGE